MTTKQHTTQNATYPERRKQPDRRAQDRAPVVNTDVFTHNVEKSLRAILRGAVSQALHKAVPQALRESGLPYDDAALSSPKPVSPARRLRQLDPTAEPAVVRHGVRCPDYDTVTGKLWLLYGKAGAGVTLTQARELALSNGFNPASASIALYNWRKFHGVPNPRG